MQKQLRNSMLSNLKKGTQSLLFLNLKKTKTLFHLKEKVDGDLNPVLSSVLQPGIQFTVSELTVLLKEENVSTPVPPGKS